MKIQLQKHFFITIGIVVMGITFFASCALDKAAMNMVADSLTAEGSTRVFTGDNDPILIADALPFAIKLYESLLSSSPNHIGLIRTTGSLYVMYANAFVAGPADFLSSEHYSEKKLAKSRAKNLYLRGKDMLIHGIDVAHPDFAKSLANGGSNLDASLALMTKKDVSLLYWAAAGWFAAYALEPLNLELGMGARKAAKLMERAYALDPSFGNGSIEEFYIQFCAAVPEDMGGSRDAAIMHYQKALALSGGKTASPYVAYGMAISLPDQNKDEFVAMMKKAIAIDVDADLDNRLVNVLNHDRAVWYLEHLEYLFID